MNSRGTGRDPGKYPTVFLADCGVLITEIHSLSTDAGEPQMSPGHGLAPVTFVLLLHCACTSGPFEPADGPWQGQITTEGNVTTVVNESGSVWGGTARLVEEASIGVDVGAEEYMLGGISAVHATDDRIYVVDAQVPAVRIYDYEGRFIGNLGGAGQGPGEYLDPGALTGAPDGRLFLLAEHNSKVHVYEAAGSYVETWPARMVSFWPNAVGPDGVLWLPGTVQVGPGRDDFRRVIQAHGPEGAYGPRYFLEDVDFEPVTVTYDGREREIVPFAPRLVWAPAGPATFVTGAGDRYRLEYQREGRTVRVVEKHWDPIPISDEYADWARRLTVARYRERWPGWNWNGAEIPAHMPAFSSVYPMASGELWVARRVASQRREECVKDPLAAGAGQAQENPCWVVKWATDVFDAEGRYLGEVEFPPELRLSFFSFFARDDVVIAAVLDEAGTPMVKRYRLVLPGEEEE